MLTFHEYVFWTELSGGALVEGHDDPIATIRKLLALAERPGTEGEGIAARTQAERLAQKHGISLTDFDAAPVSAPSPTPPVAAVDPYFSVLRRYGWYREFNPFQKAGKTYAHRNSDLAGHYIEIDSNGWTHAIHGNVRFGGRNPEDLMKHLNFHVH